MATNTTYQLHKLQELAKKHGGQCISKEYTHSYDKYMFTCNKGHTWKTNIGAIRNGAWCPTCRREEKCKKQIVILHQVAKDRGGKCLSDVYISSYHKLDWMCKEGHEWKATSSSVKTGSWCPKCARSKGPSPSSMLEKLRKMAQLFQGKCLSNEYIDQKTKLKWECKHGHTWESNYTTVRNGSWCSECAGVKKRTLGEMQALAKSKGGNCLSTTYVNKDTKLKWECEYGHQWMARPGSLLYRNTWCPTCTHLARFGARLTVSDINKKVAKHGGKTLDTLFVSSKHQMLWQCANGHEWKSTYTNIQQGNWCKKCKAQEKKNLKLQQMHELAAELGGQCLETMYKNGSLKMNWKCAEGHHWQATPHSIKQGTWCPTCRRRDRPQRLTIEDMQKIAQEKDGFCMSATYEGINGPLKWMCKERHAWIDTPASVRKGHWCPHCEAKALIKIQAY